MNDPIIVVFLAMLSLGILGWLLIPRHKSKGAMDSSVPSAVNDALATARHYRYFPQIRQALSAVDSEYLLKTAPSWAAKQALRKRRAVARRFLEGLHEDFANLARLGRTIAALSPAVSREQETARLVLSMKFQILYSLVWLRLSAGALPLHQLEEMAGLVGKVAERMQEAMAEIAALSASSVSGKLELR